MKFTQYLKTLVNFGYPADKLLKKDSEKTLTEVASILENKNLSNSDKRNTIKKLIGKEFHEPISLIVGLKGDIYKMFPNSENVLFYQKEKLKISFTGEDITEVYEKLSDEEKLVIDQANKVFQYILLNELLAGNRCVAEAKVDGYNKFRKDLKLLKNIFNEHLGEKAYRDMFITSRSNQTKYKNTRDSNLLCTFDNFLKEHAKEDWFYKKIKKDIEGIIKQSSDKKGDLTSVKHVFEQLNNNDFLRKQKSYMNAAIPYQNNVFEAETLLRNQQKYHKEITEDTIKKVNQIISFRIPYYIGPLIKQTKNQEFGWAIRKDDTNHVLPWTIDEVIDRSKSAEQFINRMTAYCSYLTNEKVLPKHSLNYELFEVLNELNGIQIRAEYELSNKSYRLSYEEKKWVISNIFKKYKKVTHTILLRELKNSPYKDIVLDNRTGSLKKVFGTQKEGEFGSNLSSHITMNNIFQDINNQNINMLEHIIYWITVFEDKKIIKMKIKEKYKEISNEQIKKILRLQYNGWGKVSRKLINELPADTINNLTILDIMKKESIVFMEVLGMDKYRLNERISKLNFKSNISFTKIKYQDIADLQGSPAIKKAIWQSVLIIEELVEIFGEPDNIMIEFAREDDVKKRTIERKKKLVDIQKAISKDEMELKEFLKEHSRYEVNDYNDPRLFLYIIQEGKCLYTGKKLNISRLQDYDVDHIFPRNFVKDDSIDNLALVTGTANQVKAGTKMPLEILNESDKIQQKKQWKKLYDNKLISQGKYFRLMKESFSGQDKESFFARQLVETRQITKHVKDLLNTRFEHTNVYPVNANIVTNLRKHSNIFKIRDINNKHHAIDAALTAIIVQFIIKKYGNNFLNFNFKYKEAQKKWRNKIMKYQKHFFLFSDIDKHDKFTHYSTGELLSGREFLTALNHEIPWQTTKKIGSSESAFYKETLFSPKVKKAKYKSNKTSLGVYDEMKTDCTYLISYKELNKKGREVTKSEFVDLYVIEKYQLNNYSLKELAMFLATKVSKGKIVDAIIHTKIEKYQRVSYGGHDFYYISSKELQNARQLYLKGNTLKILGEIKNRKKEDNYYNLREVFVEIAETVEMNYNKFLPESKINILNDFHNSIVDKESFEYGVTELFKTTGANALRSQLFGARFQKRVLPSELKFVHESITGLRRRKPKSYKHELWST